MRKERLNTFLKHMISLLMIAGIFIFASKQSYAITLAELREQAKPLTLNEGYADKLGSSGSVNWYTFTSTQRGCFAIEINSTDNTDGDNVKSGWRIDIYSEDNISEAIWSNNLGINGRTTDLPQATGTFFIKVTAANQYSAPVNNEYSVKVNYTVTDKWEVEWNGENTTATAIPLNTTYNGNLYYCKDQDYYKFTVSKAGYYTVNIKPNVNADADKIHSGWLLTLYNSNSEAIREYSKIKSNFTTAKFAMAPGTYYFRVAAADSYSDSYAPTACIYDLKVNFSASAYWESEYNDTNVTADSISINKDYYGNLFHCKDQDYYKVTTTKAGYSKICFKVPSYVSSASIHYGWSVDVYDSSMTLIKTYSGITSNYESQYFAFGKGTFYIRVSAQDSYSDSYAPTAQDYTIKFWHKESDAWESEWNQDENSADTISVNKTYNGVLHYCKDVDMYTFKLTQAGAVRLTFSKGAGATSDDIDAGWTVVVYDAKGECGKVSGVKNSGKIDMQLAKGKYFVKIFATDSYSDSYAPTQCLYNFKASFAPNPKTPSISSIKGGNKSVTLKWGKISDATGYIIYRSESKNGKYTKVTTIKKNSTVTYTDKKLKAKKLYYYKVVAYKTVGQVTGKSESKVKSVKTNR